MTWQVLIDHTHDHGDLRRLGQAALDRLLYGYAKSIYRRLTADDEYAAELRYRQSRIDQVRDRARADHRRVVLLRLAELLAGHGRTDEALEVLQVRAQRGDWSVLNWLPDCLAWRRVSELARQGVAHGLGDIVVLPRPGHDIVRATELLAKQLPELLAGQGRADEALEVLRLCRTWNDYQQAAKQLAKQLPELLAGQGRADEAIKVLRTEVDAGTPAAAVYLIAMLAEQDETRMAAARLRRFGLNPDGSIADEDPGNQ